MGKVSGWTVADTSQVRRRMAQTPTNASSLTKDEADGGE